MRPKRKDANVKYWKRDDRDDTDDAQGSIWSDPVIRRHLKDLGWAVVLCAIMVLAALIGIGSLAPVEGVR